MLATLLFVLSTSVHAASPNPDLFWEALRDNDVPEVMAWVKRGVSPDSSTKADTPLCFTLRRGYLEMTEVLLKLGANPNLAEPISHYTPLMVAAKFQRPEVIESLLNAGALVNQTSVFGRNALHMAALHDSIDVARILIQKTSVDGNARGKLCPLAVASRQGYLEFVKMLLAEYRGSFSETCYSSAIEMAEYNQHGDVLEALKTKKAP